MRTFIMMLIILWPLAAAAESLPSWNDGPVKTALIAWVAAVTDSTGEDFIPLPERIAVFDNDGTSWVERPDYAPTSFQVSLARSMAAAGQIDPEAMPFRAWFADDRAALRKYGYKQAYIDMNASFAGMPVAAYRDSALVWLENHPHPRYGVGHTELYYAPILELMALLEENGFELWLVTGAAQDFVRSYSEAVLGIPPSRVIGTYTTPVYRQEADGGTVLVRGNTQNYNGHENKPAHIEQRIGRRPVFSAGNSNNDQPMCRYAVTGKRRGMAIWIHHDDADREYDYDRGTGRIEDLCREIPGAHEVSMRRDWKRLFPEKPAK